LAHLLLHRQSRYGARAKTKVVPWQKGKALFATFVSFCAKNLNFPRNLAPNLGQYTCERPARPKQQEKIKTGENQS